MSHTINPDRLGKTTKILLVDDEDFFRTALKKQLILRGYEVQDVRSGDEAIPVVRSSKPEVVILDQMLPVMDGFAIMKKIKKIHPVAQVIMLTGYGGAETACEAGKPNIFKCLKKPCAIEEIVASIEAARIESVRISRIGWKQWLMGLLNRHYRISDIRRRFRSR